MQRWTLPELKGLSRIILQVHVLDELVVSRAVTCPSLPLMFYSYENFSL